MSSKNNTTIWKGWRDPINRLWRLPLKPLQHEANKSYQSSTIGELLAFLHAAAYSPVKSTWMKEYRTRICQHLAGPQSTKCTKVPGEIYCVHKRPHGRRTATESLIGISPLVDAGCTVLFDNEEVHIIKNNSTIWKGWREPINRLWRLPADAKL